VARLRRYVLLPCVALAAAGVARAHQMPEGCTQSLVALTIQTYRSDGKTSVGAGEEVSECENLVFRARLEKGGNSDEFCAFQLGSFVLTTPDGVETGWEEAPCVGGGESQPQCGGRSLTIVAPYRVRIADIEAGTVTSEAVYEGGVTHNGQSDTAAMSAFEQRVLEVVLCSDNSLCTANTCDPDRHGESACSFPAKCQDTDACTLDGCFNATGECFFIPDPDGGPSCPNCGDSTEQEGEECDDGNTAAGDGCSADCTIEVCGDANDDGSITAADALFALRASVGNGSCPLTICDANGNGQVAAADALAILRFAVGGGAALGCPT
jgi:cysteine-rich repeat protein